MRDPKTEVISYRGGDGSSIYDAVEIVGVNSFTSGILAEFAFIESALNDNEFEAGEGITVLFPNNAIHRITVITKDFKIKRFFFDVTGFQHFVEYENYEVVKDFHYIHG
ncbi:MAG TPA: hypothetical protein PK073_07105 [Ignavibacteriaceae bacterium]|jgi:hypothetical protein|nr:MAG: hypothetical protein BWY38_01688 [Ignavibacteria bacterium ADurb.Bin266]OQY72713.1 MAG: hypothetical protein B6D44_09505 [Ignavibacteriales bacterium UTCHB2]HQF42666.1 hypothetical protein [Ignavibacteriaceae bacterium]HQI41158.1 hypothetical protein [Ignavibacteriaceae bacterium]